MLALGLSSTAYAGELCRYAGRTDYDGTAAITAEVDETPAGTRVDVVAEFRAYPFLFVHVRYLMDEVSVWKAGELQSVSVNSRYLLGSRVVRQTWDDFRPGPDGMEGRRVQAKTLTDFRRRHPGFVSHWDPETFGKPWVEDYDMAQPERRTDLDLAGTSLSAGLRTPLAAAFYWVRFVPAGTGAADVFMPGWKKQRLLHVSIADTAVADGRMLNATSKFDAQGTDADSRGTAWISPDGRLLRLAGEVHGGWRSARGMIELVGCEGNAPRMQP